MLCSTSLEINSFYNRCSEKKTYLANVFLTKYSMKFLRTLIIPIWVGGLISCQNSPKESTATYDVGLVESKKITLPVDENTYYMSRSIFQFEENGREYLHFQNTEKRQYEIIIYDVAEEKISKRVPLYKQGPNAIPALFGSKYLKDSKNIIFFQNSASRITISDDSGRVVRKYDIYTPDKKFMAFYIASYFFTPSFIKDSIVYFSSDNVKINMRKEDWKTTSMFSSLDLRDGTIKLESVYYPSVFHQDVKDLSGGGIAYSYDYNYGQNRLVCSFTEYDSLMISDDLKNIKWFDGKSRYLKSLKPIIGKSSEGIAEITKRKERAKYSHIMYDKYRDVYYRFAEHACELGFGEAFMDEPKAREFSVIIFDRDLNIIGETKFPGNKYFFKMSFVGRDGLYISENNLANPEFDEGRIQLANAIEF